MCVCVCEEKGGGGGGGGGQRESERERERMSERAKELGLSVVKGDQPRIDSKSDQCESHPTSLTLDLTEAMM